MLLSIPNGKSAVEFAQLYSKNPYVEYAEPNAICHATMEPNDTYYRYQWHLDNDEYGGINVEPAWDISTGEGVIVAVIDTGVAYEDYGIYRLAPDLANTNFVEGWDYANNDPHPNDDHWHGTHVTGTIAQNTNNGYGPAGVAYGASIMPLKVLDASGSGSAIDLTNAIYYAVINGAQVINMSLAFPVWYPESLLTSVHDAIEFAHNSGVTIVAAAGNDGANQVAYPAAYEECIAVGATQYNETITWYSNIGVALDLVAPGGNLDVDQNSDGVDDGVLQETINPSLGPSHFSFILAEGTSMASPHVAGVAALVISAAGDYADSINVRQILESTAEDLGSPGWEMTYGWGIVDAYAAVLAALGSPNTPPVANDDSANTDEDTPVIIDVLSNDSDVDGDILSVESVTQGSNGSVVVNPDETVTYTPHTNFNGGDSFTYTASDGNGGMDQATVQVNVASINDAPAFTSDPVVGEAATEDTAYVGTIADDAIDPEGDSLTFS
jgi:serine protease